MNHIDRGRGRFLTVLPRTRLEDREFREWIQSHEPPWEVVRDEDNPRRSDGPRDRWRAFRYHLPSKESWPVFWLWSSLLALHQEQSRRERIAKAEEQLEELQAHLTSSRSRRRSHEELEHRVDAILGGQQVGRWLTVKIHGTETHRFRQATPGRPGPDTSYIRRTKRGWRLEWLVDENVIAYDHKSDGRYPLLTNDRSLSAADAFAAHRRQPAIEKRFEQLKTVLEIAPRLPQERGPDRGALPRLLPGASRPGTPRTRTPARHEADRPRRPPPVHGGACLSAPTAEQIFRLFSLPARSTLLVSSRSVPFSSVSFSSVLPRSVPGPRWHDEAACVERGAERRRSAHRSCTRRQYAEAVPAPSAAAAEGRRGAWRDVRPRRRRARGPQGAGASSRAKATRTARDAAGACASGVSRPWQIARSALLTTAPVRHSPRRLNETASR